MRTHFTKDIENLFLILSQHHEVIIVMT